VNHELRESASYHHRRRHLLALPASLPLCRSKTDFVGVFPLIILGKRDRGGERRRGENSVRMRSKRDVVGRNATPSEEWDARSGILYLERRSKPLFFLHCRLSSRNTSGAPKRDENSSELLVRFPEVSLSLPAYPFAHILLIPITHPSPSS